MLKRVKKLLFGMCLALLILVNGCAPKNGFHKEGANTYYYKDGEKIYGWIQIDNDWYYSEVEGYKGIIKSTRLQDEKAGAYYYFDKDGKMVTDKIVEGMYFGANGKQVFNSMINNNGNLYAIDNEGIVEKLPDYQLTWNVHLPKTFRSGRSYYTDVIIDNIRYEVDKNWRFRIYFSGVAGNTYRGKSYSCRRCVGFKIYDPNNIVVDSGDFYTKSDLAMGEKFIDNEAYANVNPMPKGIYRLELMNTD